MTAPSLDKSLTDGIVEKINISSPQVTAPNCSPGITLYFSSIKVDGVDTTCASISTFGYTASASDVTTCAYISATMFKIAQTSLLLGKKISGTLDYYSLGGGISTSGLTLAGFAATD